MDFVKVITPTALPTDNAPLTWLRKLPASVSKLTANTANTCTAIKGCQRAEPARICPNAYRYVLAAIRSLCLLVGLPVHGFRMYTLLVLELSRCAVEEIYQRLPTYKGMSAYLFPGCSLFVWHSVRCASLHNMCCEV